MGISRAELEKFNGTTVPDLLGPRVDLLFVGINPGLVSAAVQAHFARRGNRFYPALHRSGIIDRPIDASGGFRPDDLAHLHDRRIGITNLVARASARADELESEELVAGGLRLSALVASIQPKVVAVLGISAYRVAFGARRATPGRQPTDLSGTALWVVPNPSGLNAHETAASLALQYREVGVAAGLVIDDRPGFTLL